MNKIILTFFIICIFILIVLCVYLYIRGKIELKKEKAKYEKEREKETKIDKETIENINIVVGDDVHAGNNVLHQLAEKRK